MGTSRIRIAIIITVAAVAALVAWVQFRNTGGGDGETARLSAMMSVGGPFTLVDHNANTVTDADFRGRLMLILFGYTFCPDVCPTGLAVMGEALDILGEDGDRVVPIFITIDPERDTPEVLKDYVGSFHERLVGLTGTPRQVAAAAKGYKVYYAKLKVEGEDPGDYFMGHSNFTFLMGADGKYLTTFSGGTSPEDMAREIKQLIDTGKAGGA